MASNDGGFLCCFRSCRMPVQVTLRWWRFITELRGSKEARPVASMELTENWMAYGITVALVVTSIVLMAQQGG